MFGLSLHHRLGDRVGVAAALQGLATLALDIGEVDRARALLAESIPVAWDAHNRPGLAAALEQLACVAIAEGESTRAVQLFGCASVLEHALNYHGRPDGDHAEPERISALRALLGDEEFAERWADGRALTVEETLLSPWQSRRPVIVPRRDR
jgi:hypothetical protein